MDDKRTPFPEGEEPAREVTEWQPPASILAAVESRLNERERYFALPHTRQELIAALQDERWEIRSAAVELLSAAGDQSALPFIHQAYQDENHFVRMSAVRAFGKLADDISTDLLLAAASDDDWQVREIAMLALGGEDKNQAERTLEVGLRDADKSVREAAQHTWQQLHQRSQNQERNHHLMNQTPQLSSVTQTTQAPMPAQAPRHSRRWRLSLLAAVAIFALILTGAGIANWLWNPLFGSPDLYQTINQQQTDKGVTIKVTRVYADEGRTVIAYDISAPGTSKDYLAGAFDLTSPTPQKEEAMSATECDAPEHGITHCYMLQPAFLVPAGVNTLSLTWEVTQVIERGSSGTIAGVWHFSFTVPFHHENRHDLPNPIHGNVRLP